MMHCFFTLFSAKCKKMKNCSIYKTYEICFEHNLNIGWTIINTNETPFYF